MCIPPDSCELISLLPANESQLLFIFKLGLPIFSCATCPACGKSQDPYGDHALCCPLTGFAIRHSFLKRGQASLLQDTGFETRLEVSLPESQDRPADVLLVNSFSEPRPHALDVSLVHPLQPSLPIAGVTPGKVADRRAAVKEAQYQARCSVAGMGFCPLVYETTGAWSTPATKFVRQWARALAMKSGSPASQTLRSLAWSVSALIARAVGDHLARAKRLQPLRLETTPNMAVDGEFDGSRAIRGRAVRA